VLRCHVCTTVIATGEHVDVEHSDQRWRHMRCHGWAACSWKLACTTSAPAHSRSAKWIRRHPDIVGWRSTSGGIEVASSKVVAPERSYAHRAVTCARGRDTSARDDDKRATCIYVTCAEQGAAETRTARWAPVGASGRSFRGCEWLATPIANKPRVLKLAASFTIICREGSPWSLQALLAVAAKPFDRFCRSGTFQASIH